MKNLKDYINEGLFDNNINDDISNSLNSHIIATFKASKYINVIGNGESNGFFNEDMDVVSNKVISIIVDDKDMINETTSIKGREFITAKYYVKPNITSLDDLFESIDELIEVDFSNFNGSKIKSLKATFAECKNLKKLTFANAFSKSSIINLASTFSDCSNLDIIDFSNVKFGKIEYLIDTFNGCTNLKEIKGFKIDNCSQLYTLRGMFACCENLENVDFFQDFKNSGKINAINSMFFACDKLKSIDISSLDLSNIVFASAAFYSCDNLETLNIGNMTIDTKLNKNISADKNLASESPKLKQVIGKCEYTKKVILDSVKEKYIP
jgi:surface protein